MGNSAITGINLGVPAFQQDFTSGTSLVVNHNLNSQFVSVTVYDENDIVIIPDNVTATDANTITVDVSSFTVVATWRVVVIDKGATVQNIATANDLVITGQTAEDRLVFDGTNWVRKEACLFKAMILGASWVLPDNALNTVPFDTEDFDIGGNFDTSTYTFTAPVTGYYQFNCNFYWRDIPSDATIMNLHLITTSDTHFTTFRMNQIGGGLTGVVTRHGQNMSVLCHMTSGNTASVSAQMSAGTTGSVGLDDGSTTSNGTNFSGYLIA